jgi:hypothetical protein
MKKNIIISTLILAVAVGGFFAVKVYRQKQEGISFDNSKPGLWKVTSQTVFPTEARLNKQETFEVCLTQQKIDETKIKPIEQKLDLKELKCEKVINRKNQDEGEFSLVCSKPVPTSDKEVKPKDTKEVKAVNEIKVPSVNVKGKILSEEDSGGLEINYEISDGNKNSFKFQLKTESVRIGDCQS